MYLCNCYGIMCGCQGVVARVLLCSCEGVLSLAMQLLGCLGCCMSMAIIFWVFNCLLLCGRYSVMGGSQGIALLLLRFWLVARVLQFNCIGVPDGC